ncbi:hypothetical protein C943_01129 [Mariniradius saccharolyticus AK6]|uniref:Uncharacterized protein n=1 Tax=Mariniradius saccharolyticus AK6 TaxID=1239962 RepID=M7XV97_9BACT|nr:hypothetical protein C943_01129 [Mariniradius saccharolyticus AK6]
MKLGLELKTFSGSIQTVRVISFETNQILKEMFSRLESGH